MKTAVVFYCWMINDWRPRLKRQLDKLVSSGLYDAADKLSLHVCDERSRKEEIDELLETYPKVKLKYCNINRGEAIYALEEVDNLSKFSGEEWNILYFHTKGVFNKFMNHDTGEVDDLKQTASTNWSILLEHYLMGGWETCVEHLKDNDIVGVTNYDGWWWGNFFWTKSSHVKTLIPFKRAWSGSRWSAEDWIQNCSPDKTKVKGYEFWHFGHDPHYTELPARLYTDTVPFELEVVKARWGWFPQQRDEGRPTPTTEEISYDAIDLAKQALSYDNNLKGWVFKTPHVVHKMQDRWGIISWELARSTRVWLRFKDDPDSTFILSTMEALNDMTIMLQPPPKHRGNL